MTIDEVKKTHYHHHTAAARGYISRKSEGRLERYSGKFGDGYKLHLPRWDTSNYHYIQYWIEKEVGAE